MGFASALPSAAVEADLRWRFTAAEGEMGLQSLYEGMVLKIQLAGGAPPTPVLKEPDPRWIVAAARARLIDRALEELKPADRRVLWACYGNSQPADLHAYGTVAGIVAEVAVPHHLRARPKAAVIPWLAHLAQRAKRDPALARLRGIIVGEAEVRLRRATRAYEIARGGSRRR